MTLQQLQYLVTTAKYQNISEAADKLFISQPSLSAAIKSLEKEMGITAFTRSNKGVAITKEGEELLMYAGKLLEQAEIMKEHFENSGSWKPKFSVSCQHYSFAVNAFVDLVRRFDAAEYDFTLREAQTAEIIEDVTNGKSELGILFLGDHNEEVLTKIFRKNELVFEELFVAKPHVFINSRHPLAQQEIITLEELKPYPYLTYEQGEYNSFYYSEEFLSTLDMPKNIKVRDRATLFNLVIGLDGFTVSSGVLDKGLNGEYIIAKPLAMDTCMRIGTITKKNTLRSRYAGVYVEALKKHLL